MIGILAAEAPNGYWIPGDIKEFWWGLADSLKQATGKDVDVRVTVDPSVLGGIVTTIGDTVIDGSVRSRLAQVKSHIG